MIYKRKGLNMSKKQSKQGQLSLAIWKTRKFHKYKQPTSYIPTNIIL